MLWVLKKLSFAVTSLWSNEGLVKLGKLVEEMPLVYDWLMLKPLAEQSRELQGQRR